MRGARRPTANRYVAVMDLPSPGPLSYEDYERLEAASEEARFEYYDGDVVALAEPSRAHEFIVSNLSQHLGAAVRSKDCRYVTRGAVWCEEKQHEFKPDWIVLCDRRDIEGSGPASARSRYRYPAMVVEVVSPSNRASEMEAKLACYSVIQSVLLYLVIDSQRQQIWCHVRVGPSLVPTPAAGQIETPFGSVSWAQIYEGTGVPILQVSPLLLQSS